MSETYHHTDLVIEPEKMKDYESSIKLCLTNSGEKNIRKNIEELKKSYPISYESLVTFCTLSQIDCEHQNLLLAFCGLYFEKEITNMNNDDIENIIQLAIQELTKSLGDTLCAYISWLNQNYKVSFNKLYTLAKRQKRVVSAYSPSEYLSAIYYTFNETYLNDHRMYKVAADNPKYANSWLFISFCLICGVRSPDLVGSFHPKLSRSPEDILDQIKNNTFPKVEAIAVTTSYNMYLDTFLPAPNKTKRYSNVPSVKIIIPTSLEVHFGILMSICEAHLQVKNSPNALLHYVTSSEIKSTMGIDYYKNAFPSGFSVLRSTKAYLQTIENMTNDIMSEQNEDFHVEGYILASLARSHKGTYGSFASSTSIYLRDQKATGLTPSDIVYELSERGVLSFSAVCLLNVITDNKFDTLPLHKQTEIIQGLDMSPYEINNIIRYYNEQKEQAEKTAIKIIQDNKLSSVDISHILHNLANNTAPARDQVSSCLLIGMRKPCPFPERTECSLQCEFNVATRSTLYHLISETNRISSISREETDPSRKAAYRTVLKLSLMPTLQVTLQGLQHIYGDNAEAIFTQAIKDNEAMLHDIC